MVFNESLIPEWGIGPVCTVPARAFFPLHADPRIGSAHT
jgi:hypothetical protein